MNVHAQQYHVLHQQPVSTGAMSAVLYKPGLEKLFEFDTNFGDRVNASVRVGPYLLIPRGAAPLGEVDYRTDAPVAIDCKIKPRNDDQARCLAESTALLKAGVDHILEAPTGWGKTMTAIMIAAAVGQRTMVIVPKGDLMAGWKADLIKAGIPSDKIGHVQQNVCSYKDKWVVLAMVHSLAGNDTYPEELYGYFGLTIIDETHRIAADTFVIACHKMKSRLRLGLSATPTRKDGKTKLIHMHIGPLMVVGKLVPMQGKVLVKRTGWKIPSRTRRVNGVWKTVPVPHAPGRMMAVFKEMAKDPLRNKIIVEFVLSAYRKKRGGILILSDLIDDHLQVLFQALAKAGIPGNHMGFYISGRKPFQLEAAARCPIVLATYGMCAEGTNYPHWDTLVFATPRADVKQGFGRILREGEGKLQPVALDLVDGNPLFHGFYRAREKQYYSVKAEIVKL